MALDLDDGGLERLVVELARRSDPERFETHVVVLDHPGRHALDLEGFAAVHVAPPGPPWALFYPRGLAALFRRIAPDVVHTHSGVWYKASLAARMARVPRLVHTDHGRRWPDPRLEQYLDHLASRRTDVVVAVSAPLARFLDTRLRIRRDRICIIRNGVDTDRFRPAVDAGPLRESLGLAADVPVIGSIGRLDHIKGYDVMVEAFARLRGASWSGPAPVLVLAGEGPDDGSLRARIERLGLGASIRLLGWRKDVETLYRGFTLFTLSSRSEGTSLGLLEAMAAGLCPVVTDVGGNRDVVGPQLAGRLVPAENPTALAEEWRRALGDPGGRARDARLAREQVVERFSLAGMVREYATIYAGGGAGERPVFEATARSASRGAGRGDGHGVAPAPGIPLVGKHQ